MKCMSLTAHSGAACELEKDPCAEDPCNGGLCTRSHDTYSCDCSNCEWLPLCSTCLSIVNCLQKRCVNNQKFHRMF